MKTPILLGLVLGLMAVGASVAQPGKPVRHVVSQAHRVAGAAVVQVRHTPAHHFSALALQQALARKRAPGTPPADDDTVTPPSGEPGWIKDNDSAGWGVSEGRSQTVLGGYIRPQGPQLPGPDIRHDGHDAAGVSVSVKLGGPQ
jgi:hypothetical protein